MSAATTAISGGTTPSGGTALPGGTAVLSGDMAVLRSLRAMSDDMRDFLVPSAVPRVLHVPSPMEFLRDYVMPGKPVVFCSLTHDWPAMAAWDVPYLRCAGAYAWAAGALTWVGVTLIGTVELILSFWATDRRVAGDVEVTVNTTPNGLGDAVTPDPATGELLFVKPEERRMLLNAFLDQMEADEAAAALAAAAAASLIGVISSGESSSGGGTGCGGGCGGPAGGASDVMYFSHQNDCLRDVLKVLFKDVDPVFDFAAEALGTHVRVYVLFGGVILSVRNFVCGVY